MCCVIQWRLLIVLLLHVAPNWIIPIIFIIKIIMCWRIIKEEKKILQDSFQVDRVWARPSSGLNMHRTWQGTFVYSDSIYLPYGTRLPRNATAQRKLLRRGSQYDSDSRATWLTTFVIPYCCSLCWFSGMCPLFPCSYWEPFLSPLTLLLPLYHNRKVMTMKI